MTRNVPYKPYPFSTTTERISQHVISFYAQYNIQSRDIIEKCIRKRKDEK